MENDHFFIRVVLLFVGIATVKTRTTKPSITTVANTTGSPQFSVEILVIVDKEAYSQWLSFQTESDEEKRKEMAVSAITAFVKSTFVSTNLIWKGMEEHGINLDTRIQDIRVIKDDVVVTANADGKTRTDDEAYWEFFHWLVRNGFEFDHALLLTGLDILTSEDGDPEGYAYMDTMCSQESISIVENIINGIPAVVLAHEVAHSFGVRHDGDRNTCNATSGFIMNANNIGTSPRHWRFSTCSAAQVVDKMARLINSYDCLSESNTAADPLDVPYLGQLYTADQLCQMSQGNHSYLCRHLYGKNESDLCQVLWCLVNATYCTGVAPVDGLPCGANKRCQAGQCVTFDDVPDHVTDTCYTGDIPHPAWRNQSCSEVVASYTHMCLDQWYIDFCCESCQAVYTGSNVCPYGDAHAQCAPFYCGTEWEEECCETCPPHSR